MNRWVDGELADRQMERQTAPVWETNVARGPRFEFITKSSQCHLPQPLHPPHPTPSQTQPLTPG